MNTGLKRSQAITLGALVLFCLTAAGVGLSAVAAKHGLWADSISLSTAFPEAHDLTVGTPVRIRGIDAGQVTAIEYPDQDTPDARVLVRMQVRREFAGRIYTDGTASIHATGLLGAKVVSIQPGQPSSGVNETGHVKSIAPVDLSVAAARLSNVAEEAEKLLKDVRAGKGSAGKLLTDDALYANLTALAVDARTAVGTVNHEAAKMDRFVADGRDTLRSVRQGTDALAKLPLVRGYVEDVAAILVRPTCRKETYAFRDIDLFEPGTAILHDQGHQHLENLATMIRDSATSKSEIVVVTQHDPADASQTSASAMELTKKRSEVAAACLKQSRAHRINWVSSRTVTTLGLGQNPSPVVPDRPLPPSHLQVLIFTP